MSDYWKGMSLDDPDGSSWDMFAQMTGVPVPVEISPNGQVYLDRLEFADYWKCFAGTSVAAMI